MPLDNLELNQPLNWEPEQPLNGETIQTIDGVKDSLDSLLSVESIKNEFLFKLSNRDYETCKQMKETNPSIDFSQEIKERFLQCLKGGYIDTAIEIKNGLGEGIDFSLEIKQGFLGCLKNVWIHYAKQIKDDFGEGIDFSLEIKEGFLECLKNGRINEAKQIKDAFGEGIDFSLEIKEGEKNINKRFLECLKNGRINEAKQIKDAFGEGIDFSLEIKERFLECLKIGGIDTAKQIKDAFGEGIDFSLEIMQGFLECLKNERIREAKQIKDAFGEGIDFSLEIKEGFLECLKNGRIAYLDYAIKIKDAFGEWIDFSLEIKEGEKNMKEGFLNCLKNGQIDIAIQIKDAFGEWIDFSLEIKEGFLECLKNERIDIAIKMKDAFGDGIDFSHEIKEGFLECLKDGRINYVNHAKQIKNAFGDGIDFSHEIKEGFLGCLKGGYINTAIKIKDTFGDGIDFSLEIKEGFLECLKRIYIYAAKQIKNAFGEWIDFSQEIKEGEKNIKKGFLECLKNGQIDIAIQIKNAFGEWIDFSLEIKEGFLECLKNGQIDIAKQIKNAFGDGIDFSQEIKEGEKNIKEGFLECLKNDRISGAKQIKDDFGEWIDFSQEIKEGEKNIKQGFLECLKNSRINEAIQIKNDLGDGIDFSEEIKVGFLMCFKIGHINDAIKIKDTFGDGIDFDSLMRTTMKWNMNYFIEDTQVLSWYNSLKNIIGEEFIIKIFMKNLNIFGNIHDNLLFMQHIIGLEKEDKENMGNLVLKPLLTQLQDLKELNEYFGYFDINTYIEKSGEVPFKRYDDFKREALMQKENIKIPKGASEEFRNALEILIKAPGVNVSFLKSLIVSYESRTPGSSHNQDFSEKLLHIIEGKNQIDERQIIKPFETIIPFDPLHKVVFTALGIHIFNRESLVYSKLFAENQGFKDITDQFISYNEQIKTSLKNEKESNIRNNPDKRGFYESQYNKDLLRNCIVSFGSGGVLSGVRYENFKEHIVPAGFIETIKNSLANIFTNPETRPVLLKTMQNFYEKRDKIMDNSEMVHFEELAMIGEKLFTNKKNINDISLDDIIKAISGQEICLASFLVYLGFNNLTRQSQFNELKRDLERVINTPKYIKQSEELLKRGITNNKNPLLLYLDGELTLEKEDIEKVKDVLEKYNYTGIGRQLKVEITQKSDPRGWVAGDYTDCCMPLTSEKNKEYILREDLSYFLVTIIDSSGNEDIIAQSVLVACDDTLENGEYKTLAIDNIEIANRAIKYREIISQGYEELKKQFKDKKLIIGTTYNDDGGSITGSCQMEAIKVSPLNGEMLYSDCFGRHEVYVYNDPEMNEKQDGEFEYYGLQSYNFKKSHIKYFVSDSDLKEINILLEKIGAGEPDGEGGMSFPDNYSCVIGNKENFQGYIVAADYLTEDGPNSLTFEKIGFAENIAEAQQVKILKNYFKRKNIKKNNDLDQVVFKQGVLSESLKSFIINYFKEFEIQENEGDIIIVI